MLDFVHFQYDIEVLRFMDKNLKQPLPLESVAKLIPDIV